MTVEEYNYCVEDHSDGLYRFILKNIKDSEKAADIVQDSFEKLWRKVSEVSYTKSKSYLFSTAYHTMIDGIRKDRRMEDLSQAKAVRYSHEMQYSDLQEILHTALDRLPEIQRTVILLTQLGKNHSKYKKNSLFWGYFERFYWAVERLSRL